MGLMKRYPLSTSLMSSQYPPVLSLSFHLAIASASACCSGVVWCFFPTFLDTQMVHALATFLPPCCPVMVRYFSHSISMSHSRTVVPSLARAYNVGNSSLNKLLVILSVWFDRFQCVRS